MVAVEATAAPAGSFLLPPQLRLRARGSRDPPHTVLRTHTHKYSFRSSFELRLTLFKSSQRHIVIFNCRRSMINGTNDLQKLTRSPRSWTYLRATAARRRCAWRRRCGARAAPRSRWSCRRRRPTTTPPTDSSTAPHTMVSIPARESARVNVE